MRTNEARTRPSPSPGIGGDADTAQFRPLLEWAIAIGALLMPLFVAWHERLLFVLYSDDRSRISWVISALFLCATAHAAGHAIRLSLLTDRTRRSFAAFAGDAKVEVKHGHLLVGGREPPPCPATSYFQELLHGAEPGKPEPSATRFLENLGEEIRKGSQPGWFVADLIVKLGLLGTVIGFILMLGSVGNIQEFDIKAMQRILRDMSAGMATALYTTLAGLTGSMILAVQYYILDHNADRLAAGNRRLVEVHILPALNR